MKKFYIMIGLPGSGKSTFVAKRFSKDDIIVCPDNFIGYTKENPWTPKSAREAWENADLIIENALSNLEKNIILDATNVSPKRRRKYIKLAKKYDAKVYAIVCKTQKETCIKRNANRDKFREVPKSTIERMEKKFIMPTLDEGIDEIIIEGE